MKDAFKSCANAPRYQQLANLLAARIRDGVLMIGEALPPERRIAEQYGVSRVTVRKALEALAARKLVETRHGSGNYVAARPESPFSGGKGFSEEARARGLSPGVRWLERGMGTPTPDESLALGLGPHAQIVRLTRLRLADDKPVAVETTAVQTWAAPDPEEIVDSLYTVLRGRGLAPIRAIQRMSAAALSEKNAALLEVPVGAPTLTAVRVSYTEDGRALEHAQSWSRADRWEFVTEVT